MIKQRVCVKGLCLGQKSNNESSRSLVSEGVGNDEKQGIYLAWPNSWSLGIF